jgi:uncharacterized membrane protein
MSFENIVLKRKIWHILKCAHWILLAFNIVMLISNFYLFSWITLLVQGASSVINILSLKIMSKIENQYIVITVEGRK